jgi:hypothetical protein
MIGAAITPADRTPRDDDASDAVVISIARQA